MTAENLPIVRPFTHDTAVGGVAFSPDAKLLATATEAGVITVFKVDGGQVQSTMNTTVSVRPSFSFTYPALLFSPTGTTIAASGAKIPLGQDRSSAVVFDPVHGVQKWRKDSPSTKLACEYSPDGAQVLAYDFSSTQLSDANSGAIRWRVDLVSGVTLESASFGRDGKTVATCISAAVGTPNERGELDLLDAASSNPFKRLPRSRAVRAAAVSSNGRLVAFADNAVGMLDTTTGIVATRPAAGNIARIGFSPDDKLLAVADDSGVLLLRPDTLAEVHDFPNPGTAPFFAFSPDSRWLLTTEGGQQVNVRQAGTGDIQFTLKPGNAAVRWAVFSPDSRLVAVAADRVVAVFELPVAEVFRWSHDGPVRAVAFSTDGARVLTGSADKTARVLDPASGGELARRGHEGPVVSVGFIPGRTWFATGSQDKTARIFDPTNAGERARITHTAAVNAVTVSADGKLLASAGDDGLVHVLTIGSANPPSSLPHDDAVTAIAFSPDSTKLATACADAAARIYDTAGGEPLTFGQGGPVNAVAFNHDGTRLATASADHTARIYDTASGAEKLRINHDDAVLAVALSADGTQLATASADHTARIATIGTSGPARVLSHEDAVTAVTFTPDGTMLATASDDHTARIYNTATGAEIRKYTHDQPVNAVAINPTATLLATASDDNTARIYRLPT